MILNGRRDIFQTQMYVQDSHVDSAWSVTRDTLYFSVSSGSLHALLAKEGSFYHPDNAGTFDISCSSLLIVFFPRVYSFLRGYFLRRLFIVRNPSPRFNETFHE